MSTQHLENTRQVFVKPHPLAEKHVFDERIESARSVTAAAV